MIWDEPEVRDTIGKLCTTATTDRQMVQMIEILCENLAWCGLEIAMDGEEYDTSDAVSAIAEKLHLCLLAEVAKVTQ